MFLSDVFFENAIIEASAAVKLRGPEGFFDGVFTVVMFDVAHTVPQSAIA